jgi:hypothetical protein
MDDSIKIVVEQTKTIEMLLTEKYSAVGKGLIEKVKSLEYNLPVELVNKIISVGRIRNNVVHDSGDMLKDKNWFVDTCKGILSSLNEIPPFEAKLTSKLDFSAHGETYKEFFARKDIENKSNNLLAIFVCLAISIVVAIAIHPVAWFWGLFLSYVIYRLIFNNKVKEDWRSLPQKKWSFYKDRLILCESQSQQETSVTIFYSAIKNIRLDEEKNITILSFDRGVQTIYKIVFSDALTAETTCKEIHQLVFRTSNQKNHGSHSVTGQDVAAMTGAVGGIVAGAGATSLMSNYDGTSNINFASNNSEAVSKDDFYENHSINPATGLPTVNGIDSAGNPIGTDLNQNDINPATGLLTVDGIDSAGNPMGTDLNQNDSHLFEDISSMDSDLGFLDTNDFNDSFDSTDDSWP